MQPTEEELAFYTFAYDGWIPFHQHPVPLGDKTLYLWVCTSRDKIGRTTFHSLRGPYGYVRHHYLEVRPVMYKTPHRRKGDADWRFCYDLHNERQEQIAREIMMDQVAPMGSTR